MGKGMTFLQCWTITVSAISLCVSFLALVISWVSAKRTNAAVLRIVDANGYTHSCASVLESHRFTVWLRNLGLPLQDVMLWLRIVRKDGSGSTRFEMTQYSMRDDHAIRDQADFSKGMVGRFELRSEDACMGSFGMPAVATARYLDVEAAGYDVQSFRVGGWHERLAARWNRLAGRINPRFNKIITAHNGQERLRPGNVLPVFRDLDWRLNYFLQAIARAEKA
jgi:hypothetical protein